MSKQRTIFILGLFTALLPFLGFPNSWRRIIILILGLSISYLAYILYREGKNASLLKNGKTGTYTDNRHELDK